VLNAIYAAYGNSWEDASGANQGIPELGQEAVWLARVLREQIPNDPEVRGLLALMLYCEARRPARRSADGRFVPLSEQDPKDWSMPMIEEAEGELAVAFQMRRPGRYQIEAAIQSVHAERAHTGRIDSAAIAAFYDQLMQLAPSIGGAVACAAAHAEVQGPEAGLTLLDQIDSQAVISYQPYWAVRAHFLRQLGRPHAAAEAYERAIGLSDDPAVRTFLTERRNSLTL